MNRGSTRVTDVYPRRGSGMYVCSNPISIQVPRTDFYHNQKGDSHTLLDKVIQPLAYQKSTQQERQSTSLKDCTQKETLTDSTTLSKYQEYFEAKDQVVEDEELIQYYVELTDLYSKALHIKEANKSACPASPDKQSDVIW